MAQQIIAIQIIYIQFYNSFLKLHSILQFLFLKLQLNFHRKFNFKALSCVAVFIFEHN